MTSAAQICARGCGSLVLTDGEAGPLMPYNPLCWNNDRHGPRDNASTLKHLAFQRSFRPWHLDLEGIRILLGHKTLSVHIVKHPPPKSRSLLKLPAISLLPFSHP